MFIFVVDYKAIFTYGTALRYIAITTNLTLSPNSLGYQSAGPIRDKWEEYVSGKVRINEDSLIK